MQKPSPFQFLASIGLCFLPGLIGALFTAPAIDTWYVLLEKPSFNPPNWIFMPVWMFLYFLMGFAFYMIWAQPAQPGKSMAIRLFLVHLLVNAAWSPIFFRLHEIGWALLTLLLLWGLLIAVMIHFYRIFKPAALILIPYLLWVTFAAVLNFSIWQLNDSGVGPARSSQNVSTSIALRPVSMVDFDPFQS